MINFFRKIRKRLASESNFRRYFRYAFGEVALIVIGIFMALQLQNWNEQHKREKQFHVILEQLYNAIIYDVDQFKNQSDYMKFQIEILDYVLKYPDSIPKEELPYALYNTGFNNFLSYQSDAFFYMDGLESDYKNLDRNELVKQITGYLNKIKNNDNSVFEIKDEISKFLMSENIPYPEMNRVDFNEGWISSDSTYYSQAVLDKLQNDLKSNKYQAFIKTYRSQKILYQRGAQIKFQDGRSILDLIRSYYPEVRVIYENVGIIGTALDGYDDVGGKSTPLARTEEELNIWEAELALKEGTVKFRCNDSWLRNWGGNFGESQFPKGTAAPDGDNIPITESGIYHIKLDLSNYTYEFTRLDENK